MVKGCQRKTIHIKDIGSKYYEEAYFILRPGAPETRECGSDMISEAVRIAEESLCVSMPRGKSFSGARRNILFFTLGTVFGAAAMFASLFLASLLR